MGKNKKEQQTEIESGVYWKLQSGPWYISAVFAIVAALIIDIFVPDEQFVNTLPYQIFLGIFIVSLIAFWILSVKIHSLRKVLYHQAQLIFAVGIALAIWDLLSTKSNILQLPFFPGPAQIISVIVSERETFLISSYYSLRLFSAGLITGTLIGIGTGILIGWNRQWYYWLFPVIKVTGIIPSIAWIPIAIVIFPSSFIAGLFLIVIASWFPVAFMVAGGIASTPKVYYEAALTLGANERFLLTHVAIPNAVPDIFTGLSTATGFSFLTLIVSEMIGAKAGLGWYINWAKTWSAYDKVYASIVIMAIVFSIILAILSSIRNYVLRWKRGISK
jgi:NitT/TauT family transport system permease protein